MPRPKSFEVSSLRQIRLLASPVRHEIVETLSRLGTASIADLAESLGRKPQTLYPHVRALCDGGLVERAGERPTASRPETLYRTPGRSLRLVHDKTSAPKRKALADSVSAAIRSAERHLRAALLSPDARTRGPQRDTRWMQVAGWVTAEERAELNRHLDAVQELLSRARPEPGTTRQVVALLEFP